MSMKVLYSGAQLLKVTQPVSPVTEYSTCADLVHT